ncbi:hypothetical protein ACQY0O_000137 [Thecaphora frezii]
MGDIQAALEKRFSPPLDTALVAAIAHEPGQTLQSALELCQILAEAALLDSYHSGRDGAFPTQVDGMQAEVSTSPSAATAAVDDTTKRKKESATPSKPQPKSSTSSRRSRFGGQLTLSSPPPNSPPTTSSTKAYSLTDDVASYDYGASTGSTAPPSPGSSSHGDAQSVERLLEEWELVNSTSHNPENLRLTDEETDTDIDLAASMGAHTLDSLRAREAREAQRVAGATGDEGIDPEALAEGTQLLLSLPDGHLPESISEEERFDPLVFLQHAFPSRTQAFLREALDDARGSIQEVIDTLMTIDLIESEDARQAELGTLKETAYGLASARQRAKGLAVREGADADLKGKKRKAARRRMQEEQRRVAGDVGMLTARSNDRKADAKPSKVTVNLTDVRRGAPVNVAAAKLERVAPAKARSNNDVAAFNRFRTDMTDEELAAKLAADPGADQPVRDNDWLLTSSVMAQLSTLLELEPAKISSIYNGASFNLAIAFARTVELASERYPTLESLDKAGDAPPGTAKKLCDGIASIVNTGESSKAHVARAFRATQGRQDATFDLLQLEELVRTAVGEHVPDALDPLGKLSHPDAAFATAEAAGVKGVSMPAAASAGKFQEAFPTPLQAARLGRAADMSSGTSDNKYARAFGRKEAGPPSGAAAALRSGAAIAAVLPASAASVVRETNAGLSHAPNERLGLASHISAHDPLRRMTEYRLVADEYRQRRDEALRKAAEAWRSSRGGVRVGGKGGDRGKGGTAWYYADEARRLDAKSRAWSLRAAEALVEDRRRAGVGVVRGDVSSHLRAAEGQAQQSHAANTIDLHGVTVHQALSIVREQVTRWYARPSTSGRLAPFRIITGVGRHSPHQIAVLRPAVAKMLEREGWRFDVDHQRGIIVVRGVK